jgi:hypothetical protein
MSQEVREVVILVGMPGGGKAFYCETVLPDYERISQDKSPGVILAFSGGCGNCCARASPES